MPVGGTLARGGDCGVPHTLSFPRAGRGAPAAGGERDPPGVYKGGGVRLDGTEGAPRLRDAGGEAVQTVRRGEKRGRGMPALAGKRDERAQLCRRQA
jgi:hypothetical protein